MPPDKNPLTPIMPGLAELRAVEAEARTDLAERRAVAAEAASALAARRAAEAYEITGLTAWRWDPVSDYVALSGELEEVREALGVPSTFEGVLQQVQPSHRSKLRAAVDGLVEGTEDSYCLRFPAVATGEEVRWLESRGVAVRGANGVIQAVQGTTQDVTESELTRLELVRTRNFNRATLDSLDAHIAVLDESGTIVFVNDGWDRYGSRNGSQGPGVGDSYLAVCDAAGETATEAAPVARALRRMLAGTLDWYEIEYPCHSPDEERWFHMRAVLHRGGGPAQVVVQHQDITQRVQAQQGASVRARLLDEVDASVIATDVDGRVTLWSGGAQRLYGWTEEEAVGVPVEELTVPERYRQRMGDFVRKLNQGDRFEGNLRLCRKDGSSFIGFVRSSVVTDCDGVPVGLIGVSVDATERARAESDVREARDYLAAVLKSVGEGLITVDDSGAVLFMNAIAEKRLGWTSAELRGRNLHETIGGGLSDEEAAHQGEDVFRRRDGTSFQVACTSAPYVLPGGETGAVIVFADITEQKRADWALRASESQLKAVIENTSAAIYIKRRGDYRYLLGNPEFERLLGVDPGTSVGLRDQDVLPPEALASLRETDRRVMEEGIELALEEEVRVAAGLRTYMTLKFPLRDEHGEVYALCGISTDITDRKQREAELAHHLEWEERIRTAAESGGFLVYAQPILDLRSGAVVSEELLVRMQGDGGPEDIVPPSEFLPQAERFGLVGLIDRFMVHRGIALAAGGRAVEINLSAQSIGDRELTREIERELLVTGADPSKIVFEITETAAIEDIDAAREFSERIAHLGCKCALDDFGTGFGSLTYQRHLVVQYLKIDISFVRGMATSTADQQVVKSIVKLAADYGQETVAEGVEDEQTLSLLRECGVDYAQGFHLGRPVPAGG